MTDLPGSAPTPPEPAGSPLSLADYEAAAEAALPTPVWDYIAGGSGAETTLAANRAALDRIGLLPRVLAGVVAPDTRARILGVRDGSDARGMGFRATSPPTVRVGAGAGASAMPVAVAPMAYQRLVHPDGELAVATAAAAAGVPYAISTMSSYPIEEIAAIGGDVWFQLYWLRERHVVRSLVARAEQAGCSALMLTADLPVMARRLRDLRNSFALPADVVAANLVPEATGEAGDEPSMAHHAVERTSAVAAHTNLAFEPALSWQDLRWLREQTDLPLVVKGILDPRDAELAVDVGADAVVVSNHGGRQLDGAAASVTALGAVVEAVQGRCQVLMDSGIRSGVDVLRALALGASGVLLGRPVLWALAVDGERGVGAALSLLHQELREAMTLAGCADLAAANDVHTVTLGGAHGRDPF
ncbi:MAG: alpha-hydroxy acid oxidase [Micromonosporaceae bacterium]